MYFDDFRVVYMMEIYHYLPTMLMFFFEACSKRSDFFISCIITSNIMHVNYAAVDHPGVK